ncbi:MAG: glycosyltransferase [Candidatus Eisenbacteria bacterium]
MTTGGGGGPAIPEVGVIALVPDHWGPYWQPRHYVLSLLARFFRVVWMEPAVDGRSYLLRRASGGESHPVPAGLSIFGARRWPPKIYRPAALAAWAERARLRAARRRLESLGCRRFILYVWRPRFASALGLVDHDLACYHIDDEYVFYGRENAEEAAHGERELMKRVDQVFIHSPALLEKKGDVNPRTERAPNGVDFDAYRKPREEPEDLAPIPRPRIGYVGWLKRQLDWPLIERLVDARKEWSFVFVGPAAPHDEVRESVERLAARPNVRFLGGKPVDQLPAYSRHFDVGVMPYRSDEYTRYIYPLKLHEFLATGNPVVATRIRSLEEFSRVVLLAETPEEWIAAIEASLEGAGPGAEERRAARLEVAREHDWGVIAGRIAVTLARRLSPEIAVRAEETAAALLRERGVSVE